MTARRFLSIFYLPALLLIFGCQSAPEPRFRVRAPEGGGLHQGAIIRVGVQGAPSTAVQMAMEPADCGVLETSSVTLSERGDARVKFTAGEVMQDCQVTIKGTAGERTSETHVTVHPPKARAEVTPWEGEGDAPSVEVAPKASVDVPEAGMNRFSYFISPGKEAAVASLSITFAAESTVTVNSALGGDARFLDPPPEAASSDNKTWTLKTDAPMKAINLQADSTGNPGGSAAFQLELVHPEGTSTLALTANGPQP